MRKMAQKMIAIAVAMVIVLGMASVTQMDTLAASYSFEGEAHVQTYGDRAGVYRNNTLILGTTGQAKRLERIKIRFNNQTGYDGSIEYRVHRQTYGWTNWVKNNQFAGTKGEAKRLEGIQIRLTGEIAEHYSIRYRVHIQTYGWSQGWQYDGALAGTEGEAKRLESLEVQLVPKSETMGLVYRVHRQTYGWETKMVSNGAMSGTSGQAKRLEAIELELYGEVAYYYDVYYRVHAQSYGWLGWAKNGETAGTSGMAKRLEAIQIKLVPKNSDTSQFEDGKKAYIKGTPTANYSTQAQEVLAQCNAQRQANGIAALSLDPELTKAANIRAQEIATLFSHTRPDGRKCFTVLDQIGYSYWSAGENIAAGYGNSSAVMNGWMNSPGHRSNILNAGFKRLGVGYVYIPNSEYGYYWVQIFSN